MSVDLTIGPLGSGQTPTDDEVIAMAREAIDVSRDEMRRGRDGVVSNDLQQPGVTVDLGHRNITRLPDEVIDIIKVEIERYALLSSASLLFLLGHHRNLLGCSKIIQSDLRCSCCVPMESTLGLMSEISLAKTSITRLL